MYKKGERKERRMEERKEGGEGRKEDRIKINSVSGLRSPGFELESFWLLLGMAGDLSFLSEPYSLHLDSEEQRFIWMLGIF